MVEGPHLMEATSTNATRRQRDKRRRQSLPKHSLRPLSKSDDSKSPDSDYIQTITVTNWKNAYNKHDKELIPLLSKVTFENQGQTQAKQHQGKFTNSN